MGNISRKLFDISDEKYASFQSKLVPNIKRESFIGVRVPALKTFAKEFYKSKNCEVFLKDLPHSYYDENMLHALLLSNIKGLDECISAIDEFLPYVDNWAVCDSLSNNLLGKKENISLVLQKINEWISLGCVYSIRFAIKTLMNYFLDDNFKCWYLEIPFQIKSEEYYVNMMIAWFYATALAKQWESTIKIIEAKSLPCFVHNKTIQKATESFRITDEQKIYLKSLKM